MFEKSLKDLRTDLRVIYINACFMFVWLLNLDTVSVRCTEQTGR